MYGMGVLSNVVGYYFECLEAGWSRASEETRKKPRLRRGILTSPLLPRVNNFTCCPDFHERIAMRCLGMHQDCPFHSEVGQDCVQNVSSLV